MFFEKNINTSRHNWLMPHICISQVKKHAQLICGRVLDIGCGRKPYEKIIRQYCDEYVGLDHPASMHGVSEIDVCGDAMALPFPNESFDWVVSFQLMEHLTEPSRFLNEVMRVLRPGGGVLLMTPFMWGEHEPPHDFFRFTRYGLGYLADKAGFEVICIEPDSGFWVMAALRLNYRLSAFRGPLKYLLAPIIWLDQYVAMFLNRIDRGYTVDTATFTTVLRKP